jgi:hypothetical protein
MIHANVIASWSVGRTTQTAGTAITAFVPPYGGALGSARRLFTVDPSQNVGPSAVAGKPDWWGQESAYTHVMGVNLINGSTSHTWKVLRPLNWTYFLTAIAKNTTAIGNAALANDPGLYSTNYRYTAPSVPAVADAAISSTNNLVMYQLSDGTWRLDTIASGTFGSSLTLTTGTPNVTTGGIIPALSPLFYFGANTLSDPATGTTLGFDTTVSETQDLPTADHSLWNTLHRGDPLVFYNANATAADILAGMWGVYTKDW